MMQLSRRQRRLFGVVGWVGAAVGFVGVLCLLAIYDKAIFGSLDSVERVGVVMIVGPFFYLLGLMTFAMLAEAIGRYRDACQKRGGDENT